MKLGKSKKGMLKKLGLSDAEKMMRYKCPSSDLETDVSSKKKMKKSNLPRKVTSSSIRKLNLLHYNKSLHI